MFKKKKILSIIPARAGSKRIKNKNLLKLNNKHLVEISLIESNKSKYIDKTIICSDSNKINKIGDKYNCLPLKRRPKTLSKDNSKSIDLIKYYYKIYHKYDYVILLQPTSPFRTALDIDAAIRIIINKKAPSLVSIEKLNFPKLWINKENNFKKFTQLNYKIDKNIYYKPNGAIYIIDSKFINKASGFYFKNTFYHKMNAINSIDIDEKFDFTIAKKFEKQVNS